MRALAVSAAGEEHHLSDPQLAELTRRIAAGLHGRGIGVGDVVLVRLPKGPEWLCTMRALYRLGAVALPCVEQVTDAEVAERVATTGARAVLLDRSTTSRSPPARRRRPTWTPTRPPS